MFRLTKSKIIIVLLLLLSFVFIGCKKEKPTLSFADTDITYDKGEEFTLTPIITGLEGNDLVDYTFSVNGIVSYSNGKFTALEKGTVDITASLKGYPDVKVVIKVTITWTNEPVKVTAITITGDDNMKVGQKQTLTATVEPTNATDKTVAWSTSDASIATVSSSGEVNAVKAGTVTITATANDGSGIKKTFSINITEEITGTITLAGDTEGFVGSTITLTPTIVSNATDKSLIWSVDSDKATVDNGVVTLVSAGTVVVTAKLAAKESIKNTYTITIYDVATSITVTASKDSYNINDEETLTFSVAPATAKQVVTWSSSDSTVVTVENGVIHCLKAGTATITATAVDGSGITGTVTIEVSNIEVDATRALVDPSVAGKTKGTEISYAGMKFYAGYNAFATIANAIAYGPTKVYVASGTYNENVTINKNDFQLIGPNAEINPLTGTRVAEAEIVGKITVGEGRKNILIKGFAFTGKGMVDCLGSVDGIEISYNKVYDTNTDVAEWSEVRAEVEAVFDFWAEAGKEIKNINIVYNVFRNVKETNVNVARGINVNISHNGFYNFAIDAVRCDGGYNYGDWVFEYNEFINDTLGAYNGIYLQSVSGKLNDKSQTILIANNKFKNIGKENATTSYTCAISIRTYQEQGLKLDILYNTFENCVNYLNLRNNGATAETFIGNVNYNAFIGVPSGVYHRNIRPGSSDTAASNPFLTNMNFNYFEDNDGNPIANLSTYSAKFLDLKSYANNYTTKEEYEEALKAILGVEVTMVVNPEWASLVANAQVEMDGFSWTIGTNAFATLEAAIAAASEGDVIKCAAGEYATALNITKNNITLLGANAGVNPVTENRKNESLLTVEIVVNANVSGFTLDGFELTGGARVVLKNNTANTTFINNVLTATTADGVVRGPETGAEITKNVIMNYNYSPAFSSYRFGWFFNVDGIEMVGNSLDGTNTYDFLNCGGYIKGIVNISDNFYTNGKQSFLYCKGVGVLDATIEGNRVEGIANTVIDFRNMVENGDVKFNIRYNVMIESGTGWFPIRIRTAGYDSNDTITINVVDNQFIDSYYAENGIFMFVENPSVDTVAEGFKKIYTIGRNYYEINGEPLTAVDDSNFMNVAVSIADPYETKEEVPTYIRPDEIIPTSIEITNKIEEIDAFASYQVLFKILPSNVTNKKVAFTSSDNNVATISSAGLINAKSDGTCVITVYSVADNTILDSFTLVVNPVERIEGRYEGNAVLKVGDTLPLNVTYYGTSSDVSYEFTSSDTTIATVSNEGLVTAVAPGVVLITIKFGDLETQVGFTVISATDPLSGILQLFADGNNGIVLDRTVTYIGSDDGTADYPHDIYNSVNDFWAGQLPTITRNMLSTTAKNYDGREMQSLEFIVIHDTAGSSSTSTAKANSNWCNNPTNTNSSWHYTIGNDGIYQQIEDNMIAWHAGDGAEWADSTTLYDTGVAYEGDRPEVTVGSDGFFYINGKKSNVQAPTGTTVTNTLGIVCFKGENGNYVIPTTHISSGYGQVICARGGNLNGIGIETAVNLGSDVYLTWQMTAKFVAELLVKYNMTPDRVWFHNNFSNKPCPRTMMTADLIDEFLEMVYMEYEICKNYSDYTITFTSSNPDIIDNTGRVVNAPNYTTNVTYTVTVEKDGVSESITLNALVIGKYN